STHISQMTLSFRHGVCAFSPENPAYSDVFLPKRQRNLMGDCPNDPLRVVFDRQIKLEFHGSTVTSDAGLLAYRELDDALGLTNAAANGLNETRTGKNTQHSLLALLRQSLYSRLAANERLAQHLWVHRDDLFTFLRQPGLDATNWRAELAIRFGVILRKVWGGSRTWVGARAQSVLMSVWRTCWQPGRSALAVPSHLLRGTPAALPP